MESHSSGNPDWTKTKHIYESGGSTGGYAEITLATALAAAHLKGVTVTQTGTPATGTLKTDAAASATTLTVAYTSTCKQGGSDAQDLRGCFSAGPLQNNCDRCGASGITERAEGAVFAAAVLPRVAACDPNAAQIISDNMKINAADPMAAGFVTIKTAFESTYACPGTICEDSGGLILSGSQHYDKAAPYSFRCSGGSVIRQSQHIQKDGPSQSCGLFKFWRSTSGHRCLARWNLVIDSIWV